MIAEHIDDIRRSLKATAGLAGWMVAAGIAGFFAFIMFSVAFFIYLSDRYNVLTACLVLAGCFAVLAAIFIIAARYIQRRRELERKAAAARRSAAAQSATWVEPAILAAGLDLARMIGGRRTATLAAGAVAAMWLLSKTGNSSSSGRGSA